MKILSKIIASILVAFALLASSPVAFANVNSSNFTRRSNISRINRNVVRSNVVNRNFVNHNVVQNHFVNRNVIIDRDRFIHGNRFFRGNTVFLGNYYNRYVPYTFYNRHLPYYSNNPLFVIVNRDNPTDALVLGNTAYSGSNYRNVVVIRVSDSYFQLLRDAIQNNNLRDFRFDRNGNMMSFVTPSGPYSTTDIGIDAY